MRILIATPLYPPDVGGPAKYARGLKEAFRALGHSVSVVAYGRVERALPAGIRHAVYFIRVLISIRGTDCVLALDTWSGFPALCVGKLARTKVLVRIGGDFLWESYVERTGDLVRLSDFYGSKRALSLKERLIRRVITFVVRHADALLFNSLWLADIYRAYGLTAGQVRVLDNEYTPRRTASSHNGRTFVAAGREIRLKNMDRLAKAFAAAQRAHPTIELDTEPLPPDKHLVRVARSYAVIVPSISEVNPNAAYEAVSFGKPFICTEDTGLPGPIRKLGIMIDTRDVAAFERAIELLLDPATYRSHIERIARFSHSHTFEDIAREIAGMVREL